MPIEDKLSSIETLSTTSQEALKELLSDKPLNTRKGYLSVINGLSESSKKDILKLTSDDIGIYLDILGKKSDRTYNTYLGYMKMMFKALDERSGTHLYRLVSNKARKAVPYELLDLDSVPTKADIDALLEYLLKENDYIAFLPIFAALRLGLTTGDIEKLTNDQVIGNGDRLSIHIPKNGQYRERYIPIPDEVRGAFDGYIELYKPDYPDNGNDNFFVNRRMDPLSGRTMQMYLTKACKEAGIRPITLNSIRNLGISMMLASGIPSSEAAKITGTGTEWYNKYYEVIKRENDHAEAIKDDIMKLIPLIDSGQFSMERVAQMLNVPVKEIENVITSQRP